MAKICRALQVSARVIPAAFTAPILALALGLASTPAAATQQAATPRTASNTGAMAYRVQSGDTLIQIGQRHLARPEDWRRVQSLNGIADPYRMPTGMVLRIPNALLARAATPIVTSARISGFRGQASLLRTGGGSGNSTVPTTLNQSVSEGDILETGANAFIQLALPDGGTIAVPSNTRLRLDRLRRDPRTGALDQNFTVLRGRIESRVAPVRSGGAYTVRTPISVSAVRGTLFRTDYDEVRNRALAAVIEGEVAVSRNLGSAPAAEPIAPVVPGQGAIISPDGVTVKPLPPAPYLVDPDLPISGADLVFDIAPTPGAVTYRAIVASDAALSSILSEAESAVGESRVTLPDLPDGFHFVAISAVSADGLEGPRSVYDFLRARISIRDLAVDRLDGNRHRFRWSSDGAAQPFYRFQLVRHGPTPSASAVVISDKQGLAADSLEIADLQPGTYEWRVWAGRIVAGQRVDVWSPPQTLTIGR